MAPRSSLNFRAKNTNLYALACNLNTLPNVMKPQIKLIEMTYDLLREFQHSQEIYNFRRKRTYYLSAGQFED